MMLHSVIYTHMLKATRRGNAELKGAKILRFEN
jgi:hypothetical protein